MGLTGHGGQDPPYWLLLNSCPFLRKDRVFAGQNANKREMSGWWSLLNQSMATIA